MMEGWTEQQAKTVDRYLMGDYTPQDEELITQWKADSLSFSQELEDYKDVYHSLGDPGMQEYLDVIDRVHRSHQPRRRFLRPWMRAAAAILVIGALAMYLWKPAGWSGLQAQFAPEKEPISLRVASATQEQLLAEIEDSYNAENYSQAISKMDLALQANPEDFTLQLYRGRALYFNGQLEEASMEFESLSNSAAALNSIKDEARWWHALSLLKQERKAEMIPVLKKLSDSDNRSLAEKGRSLLKEIEEIKE